MKIFSLIVFFSLGAFGLYLDVIKNRYHRGDGHHVVIQFSREVEPFLFDLKKKFTSVDLEHIAQLNTPFSFRLYQWLMQAKNLNKNKAGEAVQVELPIEWMKKKAGLESCYDDWRDFNKEIDERTLTKTIKEKQETAEEKLLRYAKELGVKVSLEKINLMNEW